jgi:hypothetical protein
MGVTFIGPGVPMLLAPHRPVLWGALAGTTSGGGGSNGSFNGPYPSAISGLTGWWDAGLTADILSPSGAAISGWNSAVGSLADKSGAGSSLSVYHNSTGSSAPMATPRLNALLGGVGLGTITFPNATVPATNQPLPILDPDQGFLSAMLPIGSGQAWTVYLVWSRPNWRYNSANPSCLLSAGGTKILTVDNTGGSGNLTLFPGSSNPAVLSSSMTRRHTHAVILRNTPGTGIDVWLDGSHVLSAGTNPLASTLTEALLFLHDGTSGGGAQCWFHEAATWGHALSSGDMSTLVSCQGRWTLGARKGMQIFVTGQSNAGDGFNNWAWHLLAQGVAYYLGALAYGVIGSYSGGTTDTTIIGGQALYPIPEGDPGYGLAGSFLNNSGGGLPSTWPLGSPDGTAVQTFVSGTAAEDLSDIVAILWPWSESDSTRVYSEKSTFIAAVEQFLSLERAMLSRSAASLPLLVWNALPFPYGNNGGMQMHREAMYALSTTAGLNVVIAMPQTSDAIPLGAPAGPVPGSWTIPGSGQIHRSYQDLQRFGMEFSPVAAAAILASSGGDTISTIPPGIPAVGGPKITWAYLENSTTVILTIQHDAGTDLIVPNLAALGDGFTVMDGGSVASPGTLVVATACARVDATHLQLTLSQALVNQASSCLLFYPYASNYNSPGATSSTPGYAPNAIGTTNAVTDNFSTLTPPTGWDILADLQWAWQSGFGGSPATIPNNYPLQATTTPITLSTTLD